MMEKFSVIIKGGDLDDIYNRGGEDLIQTGRSNLVFSDFMN